MHSPSSRTRIWAVMLAFTFAVSFSVPALAAPDGPRGVWTDWSPSEVVASLWSSWLDLWTPVVSLFAPDETTLTDPLNGGGGTGGPGGGGGFADPDG